VFLPFNQGYRGGADNPPASALTGGYATAYLWSHVWARDSVLDLVQHFVHELPDAAGGNGRNGKKRLIFPRYHSRRSALPVYLKWKGTERSPDGDVDVRTGPGSRCLEGDEVTAYVALHFGAPV